MNPIRYALPEHPESIKEIFHSLCAEVSNGQAKLLTSQLTVIKARLAQNTGRATERTERMGAQLLSAASFLLEHYPSFTTNEKKLIVGAIRYMGRSSDGIDDSNPIIGFDDDAMVMNHVLESLQIQSHFVR